MVNAEKTNSRSRILELLRNADSPVSGEAAAGLLGISRVAVWKHIKALNENGYCIDSSPAGYRLALDKTDSLDAWEFGAEADLFRHFEETNSTMNRGLEAALSGAPEGSVFAADRQSAGRGTGIKTWESVPGGLFFTLITRPRIHPSFAHRQVLAAQCAMTESIRKLTGENAFNGWPNDILIADRSTGRSFKAGGILPEYFCSGNTLRFLNLGIGINTGTSPKTAEGMTVQISRKVLLESFLASFGADTEDSLVQRWNALCPLINTEIRYRSGDTTHSGIFHGTDQHGNACIDDERFHPGSIQIENKGRIS